MADILFYFLLVLYRVRNSVNILTDFFPFSFLPLCLVDLHGWKINSIFYCYDWPPLFSEFNGEQVKHREKKRDVLFCEQRKTKNHCGVVCPIGNYGEKNWFILLQGTKNFVSLEKRKSLHFTI